MNFPSVIFLFVITLLQGCSWNTLRNKEIEAMKSTYILNYGKQPDLWPVTIGMKDPFTDIFSIPVENAVATNSLNNAITLLRFNQDKIEYDEVRRDFIDGVGSGDKFYPGIFSDQWTGYTRTRGFLLFNLKDKSFANYIPIESGDELFTNVNIFDKAKFQFVFQKYQAFYEEGKRVLQIIEFHQNGSFKIISELPAGKHSIGYLEPWAVHDKTVFLYNNDSVKLFAYDAYFKPVNNPFCDVFNRIQNFRRLDQLVMHPTLPIAILVEIDRKVRDNYRVWLVRWEHPDPDRQVTELLFRDISISSGKPEIEGLTRSDFQFSPDGKWLVFKDESEGARQRIPNPAFIAIPVDGSKEMPLGKAKVLGKVLRPNARPSSTAWIEKPVSFVVSDGELLYKWELDKIKTLSGHD